MKTIQLILVILFLCGIAFAQQSPQPVPLHRDAAWIYEKSAQNLDNEFLSGVRPFTLRELDHLKVSADTNRFSANPEKKFSSRSFLQFGKKDWKLTINPLIDLSFNSDFYFGDDIPVKGSGGLDFALSVGENIHLGYRRMQSFATVDYSQLLVISRPGLPPNQFFATDYYYLRSLPGEGLDLHLNNWSREYQSRFTESWVSWAPHKFIQIMAGQGKHFFGEGYRSLALSDNAYNYPYLRLTTTFWKIKYTNLFAAPENILLMDNGQLRPSRKSIAVQSLEMKLSRRWFLTLLESVVWERTQTGGNKTWDLNYLNPAVFYHPVNYSLNSMGNALLALGVKYKVSNSITTYGQFILDDFNFDGLRTGNGFFQNKVAGQIGMKAFDLLNVKGLIILAELNMIRPYTYSNRQPGINYSHQAQALAHPSGANLLEPLLILNYMHKGWTLELKTIYTISGKDNFYTHYGSDIMKDESRVNPYSYGNVFLQGIRKNVFRNELRVAKIIHQPSMLSAEFILGTIISNESRYYNAPYWGNPQRVFVGLGIRCQLYNFYRDRI